MDDFLVDAGDKFLSHLESPFNRGHCPGATHYGAASSNVCGDRVCIQLRCEDQLILDAWFTAEGCSVCQVGASILVEHARGKTCSALTLCTVEQAIALSPIRLTPIRRTCWLVGYRALCQALATAS